MPITRFQDPLSTALEHEILAEKAATLGRLLKRLDKILSQLQSFEARSYAIVDGCEDADRTRLIEARRRGIVACGHPAGKSAGLPAPNGS